MLTQSHGTRSITRALFVFAIIVSSVTWGCSASPSNDGSATANAGTPGAEQAVGERLFLETRFAQAFKVFLENGGAINDPNAGDPVVDNVETTVPGSSTTGSMPSTFAGKSMNCRSCHLVDEMVTDTGDGMRTYADFARRSPIPNRGDGKTHAPRNSPALVNSTLDRPEGVLFHFDAEFNSMEDLVAATFTGRNFGWLPGERGQAIAHIARVVRGDDGSDDLAQDFGGVSYRLLFTGTNTAIPDELRLPREFRAFVGSATDQQIFDAVVKVVAAYVNGLLFSQTDDKGVPIRSPFDVFLEINGLPQQPDLTATPPETPVTYSRRLLNLVKARELAGTLTFVTSNPNRADGQFQFHPGQNFEFGMTELTGLKIFLSEPVSSTASAGERTTGRIGNCIACHAAPNFTDFKLHNTGVTQREYDDPAIGAGHFPGAFSALSIPSLTSRVPNDLPATEQNPVGSDRFRAIPSAGTTLTDLGVWNVFANQDMPGPQAKIRVILCEDQVPCPNGMVLLDKAIARFKTPGLRDLSHSAPYMHNGQFDTLDDIVRFYADVSDLARAVAPAPTLRNGAPQLQGIALKMPDDLAPLVAFLKSLNEDYQ